MESGYSYVFDLFSTDDTPRSLPLVAPVVFMVYYGYQTTKGYCYHGYVQFLKKRSVEKLTSILPAYIWLKSENGVKYYAAIASHPDVIVYGQPRLKLNLRDKVNTASTSAKAATKAFITANIRQEFNDQITNAIGGLINNFNPDLI